MKKIFLIVCALWSTLFSYGQSYRLIDLEQAFIEQNYALLAQQYNIDKAEAERIQARVWSNPTLHISEVNFWKSYDVEQQGRLIGSYGQNQQIAAELEQLIETAGKRRKRIALSAAQVDQEKLAYEELMLELKWSLRRAFIQLYQIKQEESLLASTLQHFKDLLQHYKRQSGKQYVAKTETYRIQSEVMSLQKEQLILETAKQEALQQLAALTRLKGLSLEQLLFEFPSAPLSQQVPANYLEEALKNNLKAKRQEHEITFAQRQLVLEKAARVPDLTVGFNYDRGGNIMKDFIGFGLSFDLPVFNRNRGNIKAAQANIEKEIIQKNAVDLELKHSLLNQYGLLLRYEEALVKWERDNQIDPQELLNNYVKHLQSRQITLVEFIDFTQAFREAKSAYWELLTRYRETYEELQYLSGADFNQQNF